MWCNDSLRVLRFECHIIITVTSGSKSQLVGLNRIFPNTTFYGGDVTSKCWLAGLSGMTEKGIFRHAVLLHVRLFQGSSRNLWLLLLLWFVVIVLHLFPVICGSEAVVGLLRNRGANWN